MSQPVYTCSTGCHMVITGKENWEKHKKTCKKREENTSND